MIRLAVPGALLLAILIAPMAHAQPPAGGLIRETDLLPRLQELAKDFRGLQRRELEPEQVLRKYQRSADEKVEKRERAIRTFLLAYLVMNLDREKDARTAFDEALALWPSFPPVYYALAKLALRAADTRAATAMLKKAIDLDPEYATAITMLGDIAFRKGDLDAAEGYYRQSFGVSASGPACAGLASVAVQKYKDTFNEERKEKYGKTAIQYAGAFVVLEPNNGQAHVMRAMVYSDLTRIDDACAALEESCKSEISSRAKLVCLQYLMQFRLQQGQVEAVEGVLRRMLGFNELDANQRAQIKKQLKDLNERGRMAFLVWQVRAHLSVLENAGASAIDRREALRVLLEFFVHEFHQSDDSLRDLRWSVFKTAVKSLSSAPPKLSIAFLQWLQKRFPDPHMMRILVHFIYPNDDENCTPKVRVEAVRAIAQVGEIAALPTLFYCLRDEPGKVLREVDAALARVCEIRSPAGDDTAPLSGAEKKTARIFWRRYFRTREGAEQLAASFVTLRRYVDMDATFNRSQTTKHIADHVAQGILLDDDMPFTVWKPAYEFLRDYLGKEFRPMARREKPVTVDDRAGATREINKFWNGANVELPEQQEPAER